MIRPIIEIDQDKCDGCGQCVLDCAEGALAVVDGKAKLVSEVFCDGLGACLACPQGALRLTEREAPDFDEQAALAAKAKREGRQAPHTPRTHGACPGLTARTLTPMTGPAATNPALTAQLSSWPIQLRLTPPLAPFLRGADVLLAAHCAGFALPHLHKDWMQGRIPIIACPKLEDNETLLEKLTAIFKSGGVTGLTVLRMSVPCCRGLEQLAQQALKASGSALSADCHVVRL